ncbi:thiamine phosphate synthase [Paenibacillus rhizovicinus]|uniref:Thiamine-phosphate synthase n=1 Tax=Paenibacillus rhizovicinus TaxID=2704463 RepID=A0A6C0P1P3_9BACL|nr:thiamine phosphate synthase [Paenibacillus rhizovicinus]QHW32460.1 thiamine phosphate synthase [Paenibacillus rhizovicinus]
MGKNWRDFKLYAITAANYHPERDMLEVMEQAILGGADIVQLRKKDASKEELLADARALRALTARYGVPLIINDHIDIALAVGADGAHFGQDDLPLAEARRILGPDAIIGISTHSLEQALAAERGGADYIGVGPVYPTGTKPGRTAVTTSYVREAAAQVSIPWVAIGGITLGNVDEVLAAGATRICAVSAIVGSEDPAKTCRAFRVRLDAFAAAAKGADGESGRGRAQAETAVVGGLGSEDLSAGHEGDSADGRSGTFAVTVNGRREETSARTVSELIEALGLVGKSLVVELNGEIIARESWAAAGLADGAVLELVHFVGGG